MTRIETVVMVYQPPQILLGMKKKRLGIGKYNGFGGGIEPGETLEQCAIRETLQEAKINIENPERFGRLLFKFQTNEQDHDVYFFRTNKFTGEPQESDEMKPEWFNDSKIPYESMWEIDQHWLPWMLEGKKFTGEALYNSEHRLVKYKLRATKEIV